MLYLCAQRALHMCTETHIFVPNNPSLCVMVLNLILIVIQFKKELEEKEIKELHR